MFAQHTLELRGLLLRAAEYCRMPAARGEAAASEGDGLIATGECCNSKTWI